MMTKEQEQKLDQIFVAIVGHQPTGVRGIADRVKSLEEYKAKDKALKNKVIGGLSLGTPIFVVAWHWFLDNVLKISH